jgi:NADH:ubiquinone oxidoreductase subunit 5 (subunit L)/multisubunit Na+/H+ antiporter MnhA subunit
MLQTLIAGVSLLIKTPTQSPLLLVGIVFSALLLASAFALTALAFVKIAGEVFLGRPRDKGVFEASEKNDVPWRMRGVLVILALLCLVLGILPWPVMIVLGKIAGDLHFPLVSASAFSAWGGISINAGPQYTAQHGLEFLYTAQLRPEFLFILSGLGIIVLFLSLQMSKSGQYKRAWTTGVRYDPESMQYTGSTFTSQVRDFVEKTLIGVILAPITWILQLSSVKRLTSLTDHQISTPFSTRFELSEERSIGEPFRQIYSLMILFLQATSRRIGSFFQNGDLRNYLLYIFLFFVGVFIVLVGVIK